jgi:hypothetical protein
LIVGLRGQEDREVDIGRVACHESVVAATRLALRPGERVLLARLRVQENREILANGPVAELAHLLGRRAGDDPVLFEWNSPQQLVANRAADPKDLHAVHRNETG